MFKSKIFNSVMRYMLVAMLALLPNAIWGKNVFLNDVHKVNINYVTSCGRIMLLHTIML